MKHSYEYNGTTYNLDLTQNPDGTYTAIIGDTTYVVSAKQGHDGGLLLSVGNQQTRAYSASDGETRHLHIDGQSYALTAIDARARKRRSGGGKAGNLTAQMPGQVTSVQVSEGDIVESGQTLVILEAMKMEIRVTAPSDGKVAKILVMQGDVVERGQLLIELDTDD